MALKVMVISAGYDVQLNEMSHVWQALSDSKGVAVEVIAPRHDKLKARRAPQAQAQHGGVRITWLEQAFPLRMSAETLALAQAFQPDVLFAGPRDHLPLAAALGRRVQAPVLLHTEYFYADQRWLRRREYLGWPALRDRVAQRVRQHTLDQVHTVCISDPQEQPLFQRGDAVAYLPWPHLCQAATQRLTQGERDLSSLVYIGSLFRAKGAERLGDYFAQALAEISDLQVRIIGPVLDSAGREALSRIMAAGGARAQWQESLPRTEAEALIARAFCILSPGDAMGWGQIGDAWMADTPVIAAREHYDLRADDNCLIAPTASAFVADVRQLRAQASERARLAEGGQRSVAAHAVERVAATLHDLLAHAALAKPNEVTYG